MSNNAQNAQNPDAEDETPVAKSAEDRKAATALANLDARDESSAAASNVDQDAVSAAMKTLGGAASGAGLGAAAKGLPARTKNVKVDQADVTLLVRQLVSPLLFRFVFFLTLCRFLSSFLCCQFYLEKFTTYATNANPLRF